MPRVLRREGGRIALLFWVDWTILFSVTLLRAYDAPNSGRAGIRVGKIISLIDDAGMDQVTCLS